MAFVILARGDGKTFLITESLSAITSITLNIFAYNNWGLNGLGFAYLGWYIIYTLIVGFVYRNRYNLSLNSGLRKLIILSISTAITCVIGYIYVGWYIPAIIAIITTPYSIKYIFRKKTAH
jgi:PST family polysaccharide transporter